MTSPKPLVALALLLAACGGGGNHENDAGVDMGAYEYQP